MSGPRPLDPPAGRASIRCGPTPSPFSKPSPPTGPGEPCDRGTTPTASPTTGSRTPLAILGRAGLPRRRADLDHHALDPFAPDLPGAGRARPRPARQARACAASSRPGPGSCSTRAASTSRPCSTPTGDARQRPARLPAAVPSTSAAALGADAVSFWSGTPRRTTRRRALDAPGWSTAAASCATTPATDGVRLAFEPEPGMFIDTMDEFAELHARVDHPAFGLTLDVGHLYCHGEAAGQRRTSRRWQHVLWNVHIEDMRARRPRPPDVRRGRGGLPPTCSRGCARRLRGRRARRAEPAQPRRGRDGAAGAGVPARAPAPSDVASKRPDMRHSPGWPRPSESQWNAAPTATVRSASATAC